MDIILAAAAMLVALIVYVRVRAARPPQLSERDVAEHLYGRRPS